MLSAMVRLARPRDWAKNVFVLLPMPFAIAAGGATLDPVTLLCGLVGLSLVSSAVYCYNDARDAEADRLHPTKKRRPVASGELAVRTAYLEAAVLGVSGLGLAAVSGSTTALALIATYAGSNAVYTHYAKHVAPLDVFLLTSFFVLRVFLGCALVAAAPSSWLLLCSSTLALFLVLAKRRAEFASGLDSDHRGSLAGYTLSFLDQACGVTAGIAFLSYALYSMESALFVPGREFAALPFVAAGLLDYLRLAHLRNLGGSPVDAALREPGLMLCGLGWAGALWWSLAL